MKLTSKEYSAFWARVGDYIRVIHRHWRQGQIYYNALHDIKPKLAEEISGTENDPFYQDKNIKKFLEYIIGE